MGLLDPLLWLVWLAQGILILTIIAVALCFVAFIVISAVNVIASMIQDIT